MDALLYIPVKRIEEQIIDYLVGNKSYMGKRMTINAFKKFYEMNDAILNWKKISQYIGFCNLKYCLEERKQHEEFWHTNKLIKL